MTTHGRVRAPSESFLLFPIERIVRSPYSPFLHNLATALFTSSCPHKHTSKLRTRDAASEVGKREDFLSRGRGPSR